MKSKEIKLESPFKRTVKPHNDPLQKSNWLTIRHQIELLERTALFLECGKNFNVTRVWPHIFLIVVSKLCSFTMATKDSYKKPVKMDWLEKKEKLRQDSSQLPVSQGEFLLVKSFRTMKHRLNNGTHMTIWIKHDLRLWNISWRIRLWS